MIRVRQVCSQFSLPCIVIDLAYEDAFGSMLRGTSVLFNANGILASFALSRGQTTMDARSVRPI